MTESRDLRYFVAVAERLSFSRAAEDLPLSQSALSEAIRRLEAEIGTQLLRRNSRRVELTHAGEVLLADAREVLTHLDQAIDRAERAGRGELGRLRVGFEASRAGELSTLARARCAREHPGVRVEPKRFDWGGEAAGLRDGACDVAFVWLPNDLSGLERSRRSPASAATAACRRAIGSRGSPPSRSWISTTSRSCGRGAHPVSGSTGGPSTRGPTARSRSGAPRTRTSRRCSSRSPRAPRSASCRARWLRTTRGRTSPGCRSRTLTRSVSPSAGAGERLAARLLLRAPHAGPRHWLIADGAAAS